MSLLLVCVAVSACFGGDDDPNSVSREEIEARRDRQAPALVLSDPTSAASMETAAASMAIGGTATDDRAVVRVTWTNDRGGSGIAQQDATAARTAWQASDIVLAEGSNQIVVRAYDKAGNSASKTLTVQRGASSGDPAPVPSDPAPASPGGSDPSTAPAPIPPAPSGPVSVAAGELRWSDAATWGGALPAAGADIVVPAGTTVVLDTSTPTLRNLRIEGTLRFGAKDVELKAGAIQVTGALLIGSAGAPHLNRATITLSGAPSATNDGVARGLNVQGGRLELYGAVPQPAWTRLGDHAAAGSGTLTLAAATNWRSGDTIAVGPSDFYGMHATERLVLAADASGARLSTVGALAAARWGKLQYVTSTGMSLTPEAGYTPPVAPAPTVLDERAPVANLTRNIVIQGVDDDAWRTNGYGAHVMVMGLQSKVVVDGVEMRRVGQSGLLGRYPMHWHMLSYEGGRVLGDAVGHTIRNSAIWQSAQRCIVVHATNGVQVKNNVCQDIAGHAYFLEDAVERRNVFEGNLALKVRSPVQGRALKVHETASVFQAGPSGFWITNPDNTVRGNLAGDAQGNGFWLSFPRKPTGPSANVALLPDRLPLGVFDDNIAHSNGQPGVNLDWATTDEAGNVSPNRYIPTVDGSENNYQNQVRIAMRRITVYKNGMHGLWNRVAQPDYPEWVSADNAGVHFAGSGDDGVITRGLMVGRSLNHSAYPEKSDPPSAFATYHSTYAMRDNTTVGFAYVDGKMSGVFRTNDYYTVAVDKGTARNGNNRMIGSHPGYRLPAPHLDGQPLANRHWTLAGALWDPNGYWGPKNQYWVFDVPFLTAGASCQQVAPAGRNGASCSGEYYGVGSFQTDFDNSRYQFVAPIDVQRLDEGGQEIGRWSVADGATSTFFAWMRHFAARPGGRYVLRFPGKPNPKWFAMTIGNAWRSSDSMLMAVAFDGNVTARGYTVSGFEHSRQAPPNASYVRPFTAAGSMAEVIASPGTKLWQDRANNLVWFKYQGGMAYPNAAALAPTSDEGMYRNASVVLQSD